MASFEALTEEDTDIIHQRGFNIVYHIFFYMSLVSSFVRNTHDRRGSVIFLLLVTRLSELSQKYDYPLLIVRALNPLSANLTKWSNTLKQFVGKLPTNCLSVFGYFVKLALKGLIRFFKYEISIHRMDNHLKPSRHLPAQS